MKFEMYIIYLCVLQVTAILAFPKMIPIGSVFKDDSNMIQRSFLSSIQEINLRTEDSEDEFDISLNYLPTQSTGDLLDATNQVCDLFSKGLAAVFGYADPVTSGHIRSVCDVMEIPYLTAKWDPNQERGSAVNFYPYSDTVANLYYTMMKEMEFEGYTLLYDSPNSLIQMKTALGKWDAIHFPITFRKIDRESDNYRIVLKQIKDSKDKNVVIACSYDILENLLNQALQVGIMSDRYNIFITSFDLHTIDLTPYQYSGVNLTGVRLINSEGFNTIFELMSERGLEFGVEEPIKVTTEQALMYDAVQVFAEGFRRLKYATKGDLKQLLCANTESWEYGISLSNFIKSVEAKGLTGFITFDNAGFRSEIEVDILKLTYDGMKEVGKWNSSRKIEWYPDTTVTPPDENLSLRNTTFRVLIALTKPYGMLKETVYKMTGNDRYEGFAIDIIHEISKMLGFNYTFYVQTDNVYGSLNRKTGQWNGMLRKVMDNEADLAITDLTITAERETAVDFTSPFMNLGISILFQRPTEAPPSLMSFLLPFSKNVWLNLIGIYIIVSLLFYVLGRICPDEWNNPYPCLEEPSELENQFTIRNAFWFTIGAIMQQGSEIAPIGNSTRLLSGVWWFFCLIIVSSYTANLAAFLTVETKVKLINSAEDLANQNVIKYGAKAQGSTLGFFKDSNSTTYSKMYQYMMDNAKDVLTNENDEGKKKVLDGNYAFLMESSSIEYIQERECNLTQVGNLLDQKGYGIAMRKNATYRNLMSGAVLRLQEMGILTALKNKWWKEKGGGGRCQEDDGNDVKELGLANVGGVFLVLGVGIGISLFFSIFEFMYNITITDKSTEMTTRERLRSEVKFIFKFGTNTKTLKPPDDSDEEQEEAV